MASERKNSTPRIEFSVVTENYISDWSFGQRFFEMLIATDARLTPEKIGNSDDLIAYGDISTFRPLWGRRVRLEGPFGPSDVLWPVAWHRSTKLESNGRTSFTDTSKKGNLIPGAISLSSAYDEATDWLRFFREICELTKAAAGFIHIPARFERRENGYSPYYPGAAGSILKKQLPNIAWATFFGPPYSHEADFAKLAEIGYHVEELAGGYLLLMSDNIMDSFNDFQTFSRRRIELKKHFRPDLFRITEEAQMP
ncbi:hypothetical protein [Rhizobium mayense]|uniref:Uncharacterized protein n=1 Tax=Rhizobium mayense TaxID=1312184 RepID=A0ABT7JXC0_9HYPH|nr:hypothetical protein [Rhizobium mayense]MDL2400989.1 hypothetical protein [Rhizobium mayense]